MLPYAAAMQPPATVGHNAAGRLEEAERLQLASNNFSVQCELQDARLDANTSPGEVGSWQCCRRHRACCCRRYSAPLPLLLPPLPRTTCFPHTEARFMLTPPSCRRAVLAGEGRARLQAGLKKLAAAAVGER